MADSMPNKINCLNMKINFEIERGKTHEHAAETKEDKAYWNGVQAGINAIRGSEEFCALQIFVNGNNN